MVKPQRGQGGGKTKEKTTLFIKRKKNNKKLIKLNVFEKNSLLNEDSGYATKLGNNKYIV